MGQPMTAYIDGGLDFGKAINNGFKWLVRQCGHDSTIVLLTPHMSALHANGTIARLSKLHYVDTVTKRSENRSHPRSYDYMLACDLLPDEVEYFEQIQHKALCVVTRMSPYFEEWCKSHDGLVILPKPDLDPRKYGTAETKGIYRRVQKNEDDMRARCKAYKR